MIVGDTEPLGHPNVVRRNRIIAVKFHGAAECQSYDEKTNRLRPFGNRHEKPSNPIRPIDSDSIKSVLFCLRIASTRSDVTRKIVRNSINSILKFHGY